MDWGNGILNMLYGGGGQDDGKLYHAVRSGSGYAGEGGTGDSGVLEGWIGYDNYLGADKQGKSVIGQTPWQGYDTAGNKTTSGVFKKDDAAQMLALGLAAAGGMAFGLPAMGFGGGSGAVGAGAGLAGDAFLPGALGAEGASAAALPGLEGYVTGSLAGDAFMPGMLSGDAMMPGYLNLGGNLPTGLAGLDAYAAGGAGAAAGAGGGAATSPNTGLAATIKSAASHPLAPLGGSIASNALMGGNKGLSGSDLASIVAGTMDYRNQKGASDDMLNYMRDQQAKIDSLYAPGSPEWNSLWESMSRKDAAAGRNSQYGPRAVDFMGKVADTKAKYTAELTKGLAGNYANAFNQSAAAPAGMMSAVKNAMTNPQNLSSIIDWISKGGSGASGVSEWDNAWKALGGDDSFIDYGEFI